MGTLRTDEELEGVYKQMQRPGETMVDLQKRLLREAGYSHFLKSILQELMSELEKADFEKSDIDDMLKTVLYLFYGLNLNSTGILRQEIESFELTSSCIRLAQFNVVKQSKWYSHLTWILLEKYHEAGRELVLKKIKENRQKLEEDLREFPNKIIALFIKILELKEYGAYTFEYPWVNRSNFVGIPFGSILENNRSILSDLDKVAEKLHKLGLGIHMADYVSTRGGELRGPYFVTCNEVVEELKKILNKRTNVDNYEDLIAIESEEYEVYSLLKEWMNLVLYEKDPSLEDFLKKNEISYDYLKTVLRNYEKQGLIKFRTLDESPPIIIEGLGLIKDSISASITSD